MANEDKVLVAKRIAHVPGGRIEYGNFAFTTSATTHELETTLTKIYALIGTTQDATALTHDGALTNGKLTVTRPASGTSGATADYIICGF